MSVLKIKNADGEWVGVTAIKGEDGDQGYSPKISVNTNTSTTYKLRVTTKDKDFVTPNLKGQGTAGSDGNISSEIGTITNYTEFVGRNIPTYNMDMPPLQCFESGTTYVFDREVTMLVYEGAVDEKGNVDYDKYYEYTGTEIKVPTTYTGYLVDYLLYNPVPKKEWDTWENPNICKISYKVDDFVETSESGGITQKKVISGLPNLKNEKIKVKFEGGCARVLNHIYTDRSGEPYIKKGDYDIGIYNRNDFPFILDEPVLYYAYDTTSKSFSGGVEIPYPSELWEDKKKNIPAFRQGEEYTLEGMYLEKCDYVHRVTFGNEVLMDIAEKEKPILEANEDRCYDMVIANADRIEKKFGHLGIKPIAPAMYVGLKPLKNYTIESTAGDCALILSNNVTKKHITKVEKTIYPSRLKVTTVSKGGVSNIGDYLGTGNGMVTSGGKVNDGTLISYAYIDNTVEPECKIEIPCALSCPTVYLKRGESYTFQVEDEDEMHGIYVCCWQEEDYEGIKIVEGIEPYSLLMEERMASGATKFNVKVYWTPEGLGWAVDQNEIMQEFNIKLADNTTETDYCRYLTNEVIKNFDVDDFTMIGHTHSVAGLTDLEDRLTALKVPTMKLGTSTLVDGESELAENTFYFVYKE